MAEVQMKKALYYSILIVLLMSSASLTYCQEHALTIQQNTLFKPGFGFEYFSRTIKWDGEKSSSKLKSYFFTFNAELELQPGLAVSGLIGYSLSSYNSLIFRELPFSLDLQAGNIGGLMIGTAIKKSIFNFKDIEIGGYGQFIYCLGIKENWEIPGLAVEGTAEGKPTWMRGIIGPVITYKRDAYFQPYLRLNFNKLWGTFNMEEAVQDLAGEESKKIASKSLLETTLGAVYKISSTFGLQGEVNIMPYKGGVDLGIIMRAFYSF